MEHEQKGWDLSELLPDTTEETVGLQLEALEKAVELFEAFRPELTAEPATEQLLALLERYEELESRMLVLAAYASLWFAADTQSQEALTFKNHVEHTLTGLHNRMLFFPLWWKGLEESAAVRGLVGLADRADYHHFLESERRLSPFTLDERSEQIINLKDAHGMGGVLTLYSMLTNRLEFGLEIEGEEQTLTRDELMSHVRSPEPGVRSAAYEELLRVYESETTVLSQVYSNRVRDWHTEKVELRGFSTPIQVRNVANDVPDVAVEALLEAAREGAGLFQRYFRLKAGWLGVERLNRFDLYAPLAIADREIPYGEAVTLVLDTFRRFDGSFADAAERVFSDDHIDGEIRKGKKGGAFCASVLPGQTPWVLLNYTGRVRDVATLAHELGHAVHGSLSGEHSILTHQSSLPLAETASVFAEMLLTERLLEQESDPLVRRELLASSLNDIYATVLRQAYITLFEISAHQAILAGGSPEALGDLYVENLQQQFGDAVEVPAEFRSEWVAIPHIFHYPFYCYAYSFGQLLVLSLFERYRNEGEDFIPGYLRMLAYGGSERPERILTEVGVEMTDPDFWRGGFAVVGRMVDELEAL